MSILEKAERLLTHSKNVLDATKELCGEDSEEAKEQESILADMQEVFDFVSEHTKGD